MRKNKLLFFAVVLIMAACHQTKMVQSSDEQKIAAFKSAASFAADNSLPYQQFTPSVQFVSSLQIPSKTNETLIEEQKAFIVSGGLPGMQELKEWAELHTPLEAYNIYEKFIQANANHPYINTYRQYGGWLILSRLKLLSTQNTNEIFAVLQQLVQSQYEGYGLLNYTLQYLRNQHMDEQKLVATAKQIMAYAPTNINLKEKIYVKGSFSGADEMPMKKQVDSLVQRYNRQKIAENEFAYQQIKQLSEGIMN
ncbi:hypothetical protein [Hydrotalea sandarakina]|uniref:Uncharacterized protein n=1 Tax=Hydrotalea sandarakina TaxID=1004304 RepID=A0A2W7RTB8_9BACT|nr:hypothetical protein [Hydrotalea sandarakina]PZX63711.1 hypothetical protein LX80_01369 [Hydrotalea sandarakina]